MDPLLLIGAAIAAGIGLLTTRGKKPPPPDQTNVLPAKADRVERQLVEPESVPNAHRSERGRQTQSVEDPRILGHLPAQKRVAGAVATPTAPAPAVRRVQPAIKRSVEQPIDLEKIDVLPEYLRVRQLVEDGFPLIFVTGGAGTGKSTFIRWLTSEFQGYVLLGAPTAIAALQIGGKTLHSMCQLPPAWIVKDDIKRSRNAYLYKQARLLIIDEVSMVSANLLDAVNAFFRLNRGKSDPFGGLSVVIVGDLFQLPPVLDATTKQLFQSEYPTPKFYGAHAIRRMKFEGIELTKAFRQVDQEYVDILGRIREGVSLEQTVAELNRRVLVVKEPPVGSVWLSPRNAEVERRNAAELQKLDGPTQTYAGRVEGKFNDKRDRLPAPSELKVRVGAQVMFVKNGGQWINGTLGVVERMQEESIAVRLYETDKVVDVGRAQWDEYEYALNQDTEQIERKVIGSYFQIPLMLAWAVTIHKSQGRTIERVHLDLGAGAFETGQTYVALSRCRSLDGLTLARGLTEADILVDEEARAFYKKLRAVGLQAPA